ncbi:hypothetical protein AGR1B_Lc10153 [Agrobacterium fabacearum S56]|nr:hypothetical protein AGR1B_Lc10153 [Agrobacterium fabacearum S56]
MPHGMKTGCGGVQFQILLMLGHLVKREVNTRLTVNMICRTAGQVRHPIAMHLDRLHQRSQYPPARFRYVGSWPESRVFRGF